MRRQITLCKDFDLYPVIHRHITLDACGVGDPLARPYVERHLPGACRGLLRRCFFRLELPVGVRLEEVVQQGAERLRRDCL